MNQISIYTLKVLKTIYKKVFLVQQQPKPECEQNPDKISQIIYENLISDKPCMIARFGSTELNMLVNYLGIQNSDKNILHYIQGKTLPWWWEGEFMETMQRWSGFFPPTKDKLTQFCELMLTDVKEIDVLGSWRPNELQLKTQLISAEKVQLMYLDPYWSEQPWTSVLEGKKILVVHPFKDTIISQYQKRELLFKNRKTLPLFKSLEVIKAVQSIGGENEDFKDWFEALDYMKSEIDKCDYDICLIGCGAYGFPLAAHVKRSGKKAVHIGGSLQLLFGIMGNRWDHDIAHYENGIFIHYSGLENEHWVRPGINEKPKSHKNVENSCYW